MIPAFARRILSEVADDAGVSLPDLLSTSRSRALTPVRSLAIQRLRSHVMPCGRPPSYRQIGPWFGRQPMSVHQLERAA